MSSKINVLVFPAGEINSAEVHAALSKQVNINLFGASSVSRHGPYIFKQYMTGLPNIMADGFFDEFNALIKRWSIDVVIPTHDSIVNFFALQNDNISCKVLVPSIETAKICRDKKFTYDFFSGHSFIPKTYLSVQEVNSALGDKFFIKPREGQGSVGAFIFDRNSPELNVDFNSMVVCEYLPGDELTVDCITNHHGDLKGVYPRSRERVLGGVSVAGQALKCMPEIKNIAKTINDKLSFNGMWYFQIKKSAEGDWKLLEISARCSGAQCLTRARGVNLPLLSVYSALGIDFSTVEASYSVKMDRTLTNRYITDIDYDVVYLDFDDTVTDKDKINLNIIRLIYQFVNNNIKIKLITKHAANIKDSLKHYRIDELLFDEIIHISADKNKIDYITPEKAIFIDNAFSERLSVHNKYGIPVFDVDTVEVLQEWF